MSKNMYCTAYLSDKELKEQGNRLFSLRKYDEAVNFYSKAIIKNPDVAHYFTNRALCYLKLLKYEQACTDCRRALDMDSNTVKGHFFLGQALLELENYDESVKHLQRALDLAKEQKLNFGDDIAGQLRMARKKRFSLMEEKRIAQEIELQTYLNKLITDDKERQLKELECEGGTELAAEKTQQIEEKCESYINDVNAIFAKVDDRRRKRDVPDYLCGKISFEILQEPVITPSGITYEKKDIEEHLQVLN
ncbi:e3 ubiquitin-protein ligase chip [Holotrichia oblita]|uniref:E3 ubiquitin-protein ligase chip n=1 Tax=Holotrichia oblita TaxID=644536 RepID=A0ACB9ST22_HOLOL|nr:e3 ubiquitin-protein ligase chip [Holotrichia oblita]